MLNSASDMKFPSMEISRLVLEIVTNILNAVNTYNRQSSPVEQEELYGIDIFGAMCLFYILHEMIYLALLFLELFYTQVLLKKKM